MSDNFLSHFGSFYFIGICGVSMSALARFCVLNKKKTGGSDRDLSGADVLRQFGIKVFPSGTTALADYDAVVYTDAIERGDEELKLARALKKTVIPRARFLAAVADCFSQVVAVAGCHGKTTCTAMLASIFSSAGRRFSAHIGGNSVQFSNFCSFGNDWFITEACEYKKNFLVLRPDIAVVTSTESDHLECYGGADDLFSCYRKFASRARSAVAMYGDRLAGEVGAVTFGGDENADFSAAEISGGKGAYSFTLSAFGRETGRVNLRVLGRHNVFNALAAAAAAYCSGVEGEDIVRGLEQFEGVERRMQLLGKYGGARCVADYAHHPTEIAAALKTAEKITEGKLFVVFQPHTYSRTKNLFGQFVNVLSGVRRLMIYRTFAAREYFDEEGCAFTLSRAVKKSRYGDRPEDIERFISSAGEGDTVLFLGAGDIYFIARDIVSVSGDCAGR